MIERHRGEWILMRVTEHDEDGWPARGFLLDHTSTKNESIESLRHWASTLARDGGPFYSFYGEPLIRSGPEYAAAIAEFASGLIRAAGEYGARGER